MKQPELGQKITELRKAKGLTQEEVVERCNINVRTIQRIEAGEVTPRSFTVKTILAALGYDYDKVMIVEETATSGSQAMPPTVPEVSTNFIFNLNVAWICGIAYFLIGFAGAFVDYYREAEETIVFGSTGYIALKLVILAVLLCFIRGLLLIGKHFDNYLLKVSCIILAAFNILLTAYDIISIFYDADERPAILIAGAISFGAAGIIFGVALRRLERYIGRVAELAGLFEIVAAVFFVTVVLSLVGYLVLIPAEILEIILIYKVVERLKHAEGRHSGGMRH